MSDDENAIRELKERKKQIKPHAARDRKAAERAATAKRVAENDGRRLKATGRTVAIHALVRPDVKEHLAEVASQRGSTIVAMLEEAILALKLHDEDEP